MIRKLKTLCLKALENRFSTKFTAINSRFSCDLIVDCGLALSDIEKLGKCQESPSLRRTTHPHHFALGKLHGELLEVASNDGRFFHQQP